MSAQANDLEEFANQIVGNNVLISTPHGDLPVVYADWAASGRLYDPIETKLLQLFGPLVANTHTESNSCGEAMTQSYHEARAIIKAHVGATEQDVLLAAGSGMTSAVVLLQRLLGWRIPEKYQSKVVIDDADRPVVFVSELEHHSNHTTWIETIADVVVVPSSRHHPIDLEAFEELLKSYAGRQSKVAAVTAASNVTGIRLPIHDVAALMHRYHGLCFVDYTCAAPYDEIDMRPSDLNEKLDAIYFSPHKFLGGPGSPGILVFDGALYHNNVPDRPGGGTVLWTNPWGGRRYFNDIEVREDGGTPPFLGLIKAALAVRLKEKIGLEVIAETEEKLVDQFLDELRDVPNLSILAPDQTQRLALFAFTIPGLHYNLVTRLLNDRYGIQARGGCACAGTYGHCLLEIQPATSKLITDQIDEGDLSQKPGFTRISLHPVMSSQSITFITDAVKAVANNGVEWAKDYDYDRQTNEFTYRNSTARQFDLSEAFRI
jgi:selenocysteine lyase/cysteine desulfurase